MAHERSVDAAHAPRDAALRCGRTSFWDWLYDVEDERDLPWTCTGLDADVAAALERLSLRAGRLLDLGAGLGTHAIELARRGFDVVAIDVAESAVERARERSRRARVAVDVRVDDILSTKLAGRFDVVLDRGCLHELAVAAHATYVATLARLVAPGGIVLLKCFASGGPLVDGCSHFTPEAVRTLFESWFTATSIEPARLHDGCALEPAALFCVLRRRAGYRT